MGSVLVVSPHLDDAVFSAGQFLAGRTAAVVLTMLAGAPDQPVTGKWDIHCGFADSQKAIEARRAEDTAALAPLNATPVHLNFLDGQYKFLDRQYKSEDPRDLANALIEQVEQHRPDFVVGPLGLQHPDHGRVRDAVLAADLAVPVWLYGDLPYMAKEPQVAAAAVELIRGHGYTLEPQDIGTGPLGSKIEALNCYASQIQHYSKDEILVPECFWRVTRPRH
jgi:LmbE family N-acetylglucosaminyl deacetylase